MDWARRSPTILRLTCLLATTVACNPAEQQLPAPEEFEAQLRDDPSRPGRVGQLVGVAISQHAHQHAQMIADAPNPLCVGAPEPGQRWIAELSLERRRGTSVVAAWSETRTLDRSTDAVAMRSAADYRTESGGKGTRAVEWRVLPTGTFIGTQANGKDLWFRRDHEEHEAERVLRYADGMLQSLLTAVGGWQRTSEGWTLGSEPLRCGQDDVRSAFLSRLGAVAPDRAEFGVNDGRKLNASWVLTDGSKLVAEYTDRLVELPDDDLTAPPADDIVPIERDRSLHHARELLTKLADDGLATVASASAQQEAREPGERKSK